MDPATETAVAWLAWLASDRVDAEGLARFEQWLAQPGHRAVFERERVLWRSLAPSARPLRVQARRRWPAAVAAVLLASLALLPLVWRSGQGDYHSDHGLVTAHLPDGSTAVLDADTAIALHYDAHRRGVSLLRGRAWFRVAAEPGRPFQVEAEGGTVEDLSTAFVVQRQAGTVETWVSQGRIRLRTVGSWSYLTAGQGACYSLSSLPERLADSTPEQIEAWRHGELLLDHRSVAGALQDIGRYRRGPIIVHGDLAGLAPVTAALRIDQPERALDVLAATAGLRVARLPLGVAVVRPAATSR